MNKQLYKTAKAIYFLLFIIGLRFVPNARRTMRWTILWIKHKVPLFHNKCPIFDKKRTDLICTPDIYRKHHFNGHFHVNHKKLKSCTFAFAWWCGATTLPTGWSAVFLRRVSQLRPKKGQLLTHRRNTAFANV